MKLCKFKHGSFKCELKAGHKGDHKQGRFAMFNPDQYARQRNEH